MRIGINALAVDPERPGGDVSYVREMVRRLPAQDPSIDWVVFVAGWARHFFGVLPNNARYVACAVPPGSLVVRALWEQTVLLPLARRAQLDVLFAPINVLPLAYAGKTLLTLHEAEPFMPDSGIPLPLLAWWRTVRALSAKRAATILTVSNSAQHQLVRWMGLPTDRVRVVHLGVDAGRFAAASAEAWSVPLNGEPYILWVGRPYPRKNLETLLTAFADLRGAGRTERLVLVGPPGWNEAALLARIRTEFEPGAVLRVPAVWNELPRWYSSAAVFAFPSTQESFGLPVLESMASGTPVIAGDIPALREVGGDAAAYCAPTHARHLAETIHDVLTDTERYEAMRQRGFGRAATFGWSQTARQTLANLEAVARSSACL
ncbi:MAG: glycosyltransferase family 4 protein [Chloroflexota bacterium]